MFTSFNLKLNPARDFRDYYDDGNEYLSGKQQKLQNELELLICSDSKIDGTAVQNNWFPEVNASVFLSHSHMDENLAVSLAGWLHKECGVDAFVDSHVWGYANDLLRKIDNRYCKNEDGHTYSYERRNCSTSHVHMMLSIAIQKMIDHCECLFFINTPNSIEIAKDIDGGLLSSPWIYSELSLTKVIRHRSLSDYRQRRSDSLLHYAINEKTDVPITYKIDLEHLPVLSVENLTSWQKALSERRNDYAHPLDALYEQVGILQTRIFNE